VQKSDVEVTASEFFEYAMEDWYDPKGKDYGLMKIMTATEFKRLYEIAKAYGEFVPICLRIVYEYCYEKTKNFDGEENMNELDTMHCNVFAAEQAKTTTPFTIELVKVIVIHWVVNKPNNDDYKNSKEKVEKAVRGSQEKAFFDLVFMIHENLIDKFDIELEKFVKEQKNLHGDFFQHSATPNLRLLNALIKRKGDMKVTQVLFRVCPFIEYNSTILTTFKEYQQFQMFNVGKFNNKTFEKIVSLILCSMTLMC
jgi:hypothetical protein